MASVDTIRRVAIVSPGEMGHAVGRALREHGLDVITCLEGRSERTRSLAKRAGLRDVASFGDLVREAELVLSILVPAEAVATAERIADVIRTTGATPYVADCNAVSPAAAAAMDAVLTAAGGRFIDASIIGFPPGPDAIPRLYVSGPHAAVMSVLDGKGLEVVPIGDRVGQASGIKMCYAGLTKATFALYCAVATVAQRMDLCEQLWGELQHSQPEAYRQMEWHLPRLPAKSHRWVGEMEQIAATFERAGVTPLFHEAAAEVFRIVSRSPLAAETPETIDESRTLAETIAAIARPQRGSDAGRTV